MINLSSGQTKVFDQIMKWHKGPEQSFVLAGYAGAGKTTLAKFIADEIGPMETAFCAYTGKAANVLREKGCENTGTLHSYLYALTDHDRKKLAALEAAVESAREAGDMTQAAMLTEELAEKRIAFRKPKFQLNMDSKLKDAKLVIVDEYSMLNDAVIHDLHKVGKKILYLGDPFQLPPVSGECSLKPHAFIDEIHRQALESAIIRVSKEIREGGRPQYGRDGDFDYLRKRETTPELYTEADQLIVGRNKTRAEWNKRFRERKGFDSKLPMIGDKIICLKNNHEIGLFNGMIGTCQRECNINQGSERYLLDFDQIRGLFVWVGDVMGEGHKYDGYKKEHRELERFNFAYAITCHKSQGSEFDNVVVYNEPVGRDETARRWLYTAITRGKKKVTLVEPN